MCHNIIGSADLSAPGHQPNPVLDAEFCIKTIFEKSQMCKKISTMVKNISIPKNFAMFLSIDHIRIYRLNSYFRFGSIGEVVNCELPKFKTDTYTL